MNISITVMAHPRRIDQALALHNKLTVLPFVACTITWDKKNNEWDTGRRSLRKGRKLTGKRAEWHIVIQDDAVIPDNFYELVEGALSNVPSKSLVSFYTGQVRPFKKRVTAAVEKAKYASWLRHYLLFWGVGIAVPSDHIDAILEYCDQREEQYDTRIGIFYQANMLPVYYTMPSLVDHDDDLGSLLNHGNTPERRIAHNFVSGPVNWNKDVIDI